MAVSTSGRRGTGGAPAIELRGISKRYGPVQAVDRVSVRIAPGEVYALLGLNGSGKTTLIRLLLGMVRPGGGSARVLGRPVGDPSAWARVGYLVESPAAYPEPTVRENLEVVRRLRRLRGSAPVDEAIALLGLGPYAGARARTLSQGNLQRLGLAKALLHRPDIVVPDEPVNALDPAGVVGIRGLLASLAREHGTTVLLSSHLLGEVSRLATRIGVLHAGRLVDEFATADLARRVRRRLEVTTRDDARALQVLHAAGFTARRAPQALLLEDVRATDRPDAVTTALVAGGVPPVRLAVVEEDLESWFLRLVGHGPPTAGEGADGR